MICDQEMTWYEASKTLSSILVCIRAVRLPYWSPRDLQATIGLIWLDATVSGVLEVEIVPRQFNFLSFT